MSNKLYDILKKICMVILPALGTFYFALSEIWNLPYAPEVTGTITALVTFLGICLGFSTSRYNSEEEHDVDGIVFDDTWEE